MATAEQHFLGAPDTRTVWTDLPDIVQTQILKALANDDFRHSVDDKKARAAYAAVCPQWRDFFESLNFGKLVLHQADLDELWNITQRRQNARSDGGWGQDNIRDGVSPMPRVHHIWLRVELRTYVCADIWTTSYTEPESYLTSTRNNILFTKALWMLLDILSTWKRDESTHRSPFTLELSARSPSDAKHIFQDIAELQGDYPHFLDSSAQKEHLVRRRNELATHPIQDPPHHFFNAERYFWVAGTRMYVKYRTMRILRLDFSGISESDRRQTPNSTTRLPQVRMITSLLIRRQSYSQLHPGDLGALFTDSLTGLCHIRLEKWRAPCRSGGWKQTGTWWSQRNDISYGPIAHVGPYKSETKELLDLLSRREQLERNGLLVAHLPSSLESLHLMEDIDLCIYGEKLLKIPRQSNILVLKALAISVPHLKHLSISFLSDANECLSFSAGSFPNLESVAFTSQHYLQPSGGKLDDLLHKAATAAMEMPNLQIMELWNCIDGHAAIFRYESRSTAKTTASTLTWRCSWQGWNSVVGGSVIEAWSQVAATNADRRLQFKVEPLRDEASKYAQYGGVLHHLKLRESILDGISEMQVRVGAGTEDETPVAVWKS